MWRSLFMFMTAMALTCAVVAVVGTYSYIDALGDIETLTSEKAALQASLDTVGEWQKAACEQRIHARDMVCNQNTRLLKQALSVCAKTRALAEQLRKDPERLLEVYRDLLSP